MKSCRKIDIYQYAPFVTPPGNISGGQALPLCISG